jgi:hypothetical protein
MRETKKKVQATSGKLAMKASSLVEQYQNPTTNTSRET